MCEHEHEHDQVNEHDHAYDHVDDCSVGSSPAP